MYQKTEVLDFNTFFMSINLIYFKYWMTFCLKHISQFSMFHIICISISPGDKLQHKHVFFCFPFSCYSNVFKGLLKYEFICISPKWRTWTWLGNVWRHLVLFHKHHICADPWCGHTWFEFSKINIVVAQWISISILFTLLVPQVSYYTIYALNYFDQMNHYGQS